MLCNLASDGFLFVDPNHPDPNDPQSLSLPGCIIAAPSSPVNTPGIDQDYVYNWTRDAAITAIEIAAAKMPTTPESGVQPLADYGRAKPARSAPYWDPVVTSGMWSI